MGSAEIGAALGDVSRTRVSQITGRKGFPDPLAVLAMGQVWWADEVEDWIAANRSAAGLDED